jgi:hypothetical protein
MANNRLSMRKITEVLRLYFEHSRSKREIAPHHRRLAQYRHRLPFAYQTGGALGIQFPWNTHFISSARQIPPASAGVQACRGGIVPAAGASIARKRSSAGAISISSRLIDSGRSALQLEMALPADVTGPVALAQGRQL